MDVGDWFALAAVLASVVSVALSSVIGVRQFREERRFAQITKDEARKAEMLTALQGDKEEVAFAALRLSKTGLPSEDREYRAEVILALVQAAVFEGSDVAPNLPSFITGLCSRSDPFGTGLRTRSG